MAYWAYLADFAMHDTWPHLLSQYSSHQMLQLYLTERQMWIVKGRGAAAAALREAWGVQQEGATANCSFSAAAYVPASGLSKLSCSKYGLQRVMHAQTHSCTIICTTYCLYTLCRSAESM